VSFVVATVEQKLDHETHEAHESVDMAEVVFREDNYQIMGVCFEVYKEMGCGFLEPVYQERLEREFNRRGIPSNIFV
jgi:hypothetical protein